MKKILEIIIIIGLIAFLGFGIYFSTRDFYKTIEKETPVVEIHKEKTEETSAETPSPQEPVQQEVKKPITTVQTMPQKTEEHKEENHLVSLGTYKITAYCGCAKCCGKTDGITASGTKVTAGRTIAAPPEIPFGTKISINGHIYTVEDRGGAIKGNRIDIYFETHQAALDFGVQYIEVFKVVE